MKTDQLCVFSKHLAGPPLSEVAEKLAQMGITGIDLTVRPGGHIEPENAAEALPRAAEELMRHGVRIAQITTNITDAHDKNTRPLLEAAAKCGIGFYKLGYYSYKEFGTLRKLRTEVAAKMQDLAHLSLEIGLQAGFHNHSHNFFGASLWDIDYVLQNVSPRAIGLYFDPAHATIEGNSSGWKQGLDLMKERVVMLAVKDFTWVERGYAGGRRFGVQWCPLQTGNTRWNEVLPLLQTLNFSGPISLHSEYQGGHSWRDLSTNEVFAQTAEDAAVFRQWMREAQTNQESAS